MNDDAPQFLCLHRAAEHRITRKKFHALSGVLTHGNSVRDRTASATGHSYATITDCVFTHTSNFIEKFSRIPYIYNFSTVYLKEGCSIWSHNINDPEYGTFIQVQFNHNHHELRRIRFNYLFLNSLHIGCTSSIFKVYRLMWDVPLMSPACQN